MTRSPPDEHRDRFAGRRTPTLSGADGEPPTTVAARAAGPPPPVPDDHLLIIFGATGDLARRKLLPGLFHLAAAGMMPAHYRIVSSGSPEGAPNADGFRSQVRAALAEFGRREITDESWEPFARNLSFAPATAAFTIANELKAYERLIHDAMLGDHTLFTRSDGIERLWEVSAPLLERPPKPLPYARGSWGPDAIDRLVSPGHWHLPDTDNG